MGKIADAFDAQIRQYNQDRVFILRSVIVNGEARLARTTDKSISNVLSFKGTGDTKRFSEILVEYIQYCDWWLKTLHDTGKRPTENNPWLDAWVVRNNYQVVYENGDISLNKSSKLGVLS